MIITITITLKIEYKITQNMIDCLEYMFITENDTMLSHETRAKRLSPYIVSSEKNIFISAFVFNNRYIRKIQTQKKDGYSCVEFILYVCL